MCPQQGDKWCHLCLFVYGAGLFVHRVLCVTDEYFGSWLD